MKAQNTTAVCVILCHILALMNVSSGIQVAALGRVKQLDSIIGPELVIECNIDWQDFETYLSHRWEHGGIILSENTRLSSGVSSRYSLSPDGFTLSVRNLVQSDEGLYICHIIYSDRDFPGDYNAGAIANVIFSQYLPPVDYPECSLTPASPLTISSTPLFGCVVDPASTNVPISIQLILVRSDGSVILLGDTSGFTRVLTAEDNGAEFRCTMTSPTFPTASRTCSVGPIIVVPPGQLIPMTLAPARPTMRSAIRTTAKQKDTPLSGTMSTTQSQITFNTTLGSSLELGVIIGLSLGIVVVVIIAVTSMAGVIIHFRRKIQKVSNPDMSTESETYIELDKTSRQPEAVYQGMTNPKELNSTDNYLSLDVNSLSTTDAEYRSLNDNTMIGKKKTDQDSIYHEIPENKADRDDYAYVNPTEVSKPVVNPKKEW